MATRAQKVRLAVFLIFGTSVLAGFLLVVAGARLLRQRVVYYIEFDESVGGLAPGDPVKYQGINVGRVEDTRVSAQEFGVVVVEISLAAERIGSAIRRDTQARLYSQGVTGLKYIELSGGSADAPVLAYGDTLPAHATFLSNMEERAEVLMSRIEALLANLTQMTSMPNQRRLSHMLEAGTALMENTSALVGDNRQDLDRIVGSLAVVTENLAATTASMRATMDSLHALAASQDTRGALQDLRVTTRAVRQQLEGPLPELLANLSRMAGNIDTAVTHVDLTVLQSRKNLLDAMQNLEETLLNVRQATELIREDPSILIRGRAEQ